LTIKDELTAGREDLGLEDLLDAIGAFLAERDWKQLHVPINLAMALSVKVAKIVKSTKSSLRIKKAAARMGRTASLHNVKPGILTYTVATASPCSLNPP